MPALGLELIIRYRDERTGVVTERSLGPYGQAYKNGVVVGSDPRCQVVLDGPGVKPRHLIAHRVGHHTYITLFDEPEVKQRVDQRPFVIGPYRFQFAESNNGVPYYLNDLD